MPDRVRLYLVRHGEAAAKWTEADDPGLSDLGRAQADAAAAALAAFGPLPVKSSPLKRARETAAPLSRRWERPVEIIPTVAEIPSPGIARHQRQGWLLDIMAGGWGQADRALARWRGDLVETLTRQPDDCAIFSHFVAINAAVGAATGDDAVISFRPDNASVTILETDGRSLFLIERGHEAETIVR
jgi:broad specificity phosphatase PhoE